MSAGFIRGTILVAVSTGLWGVGDGFDVTNRACAQSMTAGTYNIQVAVTGDAIDQWINTRRHLVFESIVANQPDFLGFQEAYARRSNSQGITQQTALGQLFEGTKWRYFSWEAQNVFNMNPFIVNTDRFSPVDFGTTTVDIEQFLGPVGWQEFFDLHRFFHGDPNTGNVHFLGPLRYVNWVVADDLVGGGRVAFLTSHYETFIGENRRGPQYDKLFARFSDLVNSSFGYVSRQIIAQAELLESNWGALEAIVGGDFETPDPELPSQREFTDAGYAETWRFINGNGRRPTRGIDNMFVMPRGFTINDSYYDQAAYTNGASDHKPLYAEVTLLLSRPGDLNCDGVFNGGDIDPFFLALGDPAAYALAFPGCDISHGDMNGDGLVNGADIDPFFLCLGGGACP
ncbi:MAG: hypothetical protein IH986_05675 [Planctomycetes bacterium]|nr:hypothetical protein [Planctomycetota bacterium]